MKNQRSNVELVDVSGRLVPKDTTTSGRRTLEIGLMIAAAVLLGLIVPPLCKHLAEGNVAMGHLELSGDENTPAMAVSDSEVNHLRRLLAWIRLEYTLDEDMQRGYLTGAAEAVRHGVATEEQAAAIVQAKAEEINRCPAYVRQAVKMLSKAVSKHDRRSGIVDEEAKG